jgi:phosphatidylserine/phosphatidylglycerophosphate/cardiolipin synthase-like enzyme
MRLHPVVAGLLLLAAGCQGPEPSAAAPSSSPSAQPATEVYFSPRGGCTAAVVRALFAARHTILVQAYGFTSEAIANALLTKAKAGVRVEILLDRKSNLAESSQGPWLVGQGVPVFLDGEHAIAHNKVMVIDDEVVITGSFNFTGGAELRNAENLLVIHDRALAAQYADNWRAHRAHSEPWPATEPASASASASASRSVRSGRGR